MRKSLVTGSLAVFGILGFSICFSNHANASRARALVFGTGDGGAILGKGGNNGSFQTDDSFNIFYNPAYLNDYTDWFTVEKSNAIGDASNSNVIAPQGGFVSNFGMFNLGFFFNRIESINTVSTPGVAVTNDYSNKGQMAPIEVLFGMESKGIKWGLGLSFAAANVSNKASKDRDMNIRGGVSYMGFDPYVNVKVMGKDDITGTQPTYHKEYGTGMKYTWGEWSPYGAWNYYEIDPNGINNELRYTSWGLGLSRNTRVTQGVHLGYSVGYWLSNKPLVRSGGSGGYQLMVPVSVFAEGDATSWLSLRAGLTYGAVDTNGGVSATTDRTKGRIGATIRVSKIDVDWVVGNNGTATTSATEIGAMDSAGFDISNRFFTAASLTYKW